MFKESIDEGIVNLEKQEEDRAAGESATNEVLRQLKEDMDFKLKDARVKDRKVEAVLNYNRLEIGIEKDDSRFYVHTHEPNILFDRTISEQTHYPITVEYPSIPHRSHVYNFENINTETISCKDNDEFIEAIQKMLKSEHVGYILKLWMSGKVEGSLSEKNR